MHLSHLSLVDFRSYESAELPLSAGVTTLVGLNGQGKTNLVEAAAYLSTLGSHRVATDAPLVRFGAGQAVVRGVVAGGGRETVVELEITPGRANRARLNRSPVPRPRDVLGILRTVVFAPEDLAMVKGDPSERRRFLDELLVARQPRWAGVRADYDRVLRQRNALLKSAAPVLRRGVHRRWGTPPAPPGVASPGPPGVGLLDAMSAADGAPIEAAVPSPISSADNEVDPASATSPRADASAAKDPSSTALHTLEVWNAHLARVGAALLYARLRLLRDLAPYLADAYERVSAGQSEPAVHYKSSLLDAAAARIAGGQVPEQAELETELLAALDHVRSQEIDRGVSLVGPHRDDIVITLGELPAKGYASHGESWSLALGLRLAAYQLLRHDLGDDPVLVLDDVFAELDSGRRERLAALVGDCEQVIVTAAVLGDVPAVLATSGQTYRVTLGQVVHEP